MKAILFANTEWYLLRELGLLLYLTHLYRRERPDVAHHFTVKCVIYTVPSPRPCPCAGPDQRLGVNPSGPVCYRCEYRYRTTAGEEPQWTPQLHSFIAFVMIC